MLAGENINVAYGFDCECIGDLWFDCDLWLWELLAEKCGAGVYWMLAVAVGVKGKVIKQLFIYFGVRKNNI